MGDKRPRDKTTLIGPNRRADTISISSALASPERISYMSRDCREYRERYKARGSNFLNVSIATTVYT